MDENTRHMLEMTRDVITDILSTKSHWIKVEEQMPNDNERVVVRTKNGATFFLSPIGGKFPNTITHWFRLPEINN